MTRFILHRAAWLIPVSNPPIENGAVLVEGNLIREVGSYPDLKAYVFSDTKVLDHGDAALVPALVNAHTHLELSCLAGKLPLPQESFRHWLYRILDLRSSLHPDVLQKAVGDTLGELISTGCISCLDITNGASLGTEFRPQFPKRFVFWELLGFNEQDLFSLMSPEIRSCFHHYLTQNKRISIGAHSCYATSASLIRQAKRWCKDRGFPFTIHVAEHEDEVEFLRTGTGFCREILETLGRWTPAWDPPHLTPVAYLEKLGVLDSRTILVHAVHLSDEDWEIVSRNRSSVCFCPRSNENLQVGLPNITKCFDLGIRAVLGTDSLASNRDLSLMAEAQFLLSRYPQIPPSKVIQMMTLDGAKASGEDKYFGSLEPGKTSLFLIVPLPPYAASHELHEAVIYSSNKGAWRWSHPLTAN